MMRVFAMRNKEFESRERATADRLGRFRGDMCDVDFAQLVSDVLRLRDKADGLDRGVPSPFFDSLKAKPERT
jgi:hypothetical protein